MEATMRQKNYYAILGIPRTASFQEIYQAYRKLSLRYHPDRNPDDPKAAMKFRAISQAHEILSDKRKRRQYDQKGQISTRGSGQKQAETYFGRLFGGES